MKRISKSILKCIMTFVLVVAMVLGAMPLPQFTITANAETTTSTVNVGGTDYTLFTGFTATAGTAGTFGYANFVDGNTSTEWQVIKKDEDESPFGDFAGGEADPAYVEFHADAPFIPKGYILTYDNTYNENWKPTSWALKAKQNESDDWTTINSSNSSLGNGSRFEIACNNDGDNQYQYFRFEIYNVGTTYQSILNELEFYGNAGFIHLTPKVATCTEIGIKQECWYSNGKYFSDANGTTELDELAVVEPMKAHTCVHHEASATNTEYWQCSVCGKYFSDSGCTNEISEAEATIGVFGELADGRYTLSSQTYTLTGDENTAGYIYVPEGVTATIDLNGHTIDRGLTSADNNGSVIIVAGTLTITDSGTDGKIQGGYDGYAEHGFYVSGVEVQNGATFNLQGGTLVGRNQDYDYTVAVDDNGSFTMTGGKITGGRTGVLAFGNVTLTGGEISGNSNSGVHVSENISISGNPVITGNTVMNVDLRSSGGICKINITGALTDGANIGITVHNPTDNSPVTVTSGYNTYNSVSPDTYFSLDNDGQIQTSPFDYMTVVMGWNEDRTEIAVGTASRTVNFDLQGHGSNIEAVSLLNGYKLIEPTEPTAEGWSFGGWYTDANCTDDSEWSFNSGVTSDMTLYALWTQGQTYRVTLPENMLLVSADNEAVGGKYPTGTNIRFKVKSADYVVDGNVKNGEDVLTADGDGIYTVTVGDADITITATVKKAVEANKELSGSESYTAQDGDVLTGSTSGTVTIANNANIILSDAEIGGGIVCEGSATITLVGDNSVTGATNKAGIQVGGSGTTLTIKGNGSLTANGGDQSAGIGLSRAWDVDNTGGNIVIEGGNITATGGSMGAGIGLGVAYDNSPRTITLGNITIKGGSVTATGGNQGKGIGTGYVYGLQNASNIGVGTITITTGIDRVEASSISESITYMHGESEVTANKTDYFAIGEDGNRRLIVQKPVIADIPDQTYSGSAITPEPLVTAGSLSLTKGTDYVYSYTNNTNIGTATVRATFQGDYASLGYVEKEFTIAPKPISITSATATERDYEKGSTSVEISAVTFDGATLANETDYTVTGAMDDDTAGDSKSVTVTVTLTNGNYTFGTNGNTTTTNVKINKVNHDGVTASGSAKYGAEGTVDLSSLIEAGGNLGAVSVSDTSNVLDGTPTIETEGKTLKFKFSNNSDNVGKTATVTIPVTGAANYKDYNIVVTLTVTDKVVPTLSVSDFTKTYDGNAVTVAQLTKTAKDGSLDVEGTWDFEGTPGLKDVSDSGTITVRFTPSNTTDYESATATFTLTINRKAVTVKADNKNMVVGTTPEPELTATVSGTIGNDTVSYTITREAGTAVGTYTITPSGDTEQGNYTVSYETGKFTITEDATVPVVKKAPKAITGLVYNGSPQALVELGEAENGTMYYAVTTENTAPADNLYTTSNYTATNARTYYVWYKVVGDENHNDVEPKSLVVTINEKQQTSNGTISTTGIYCASNHPSIQAGMVIQKSNEADTVEYRWVACDSSKPGKWFEVSPWTKDNNWMNWKPEKSGAYVIVCYARVVGNEEESLIQYAFGTEYHSGIKGICQIPYTGEGGGYLIGIESYNNPNNSYQYEMLILDCSLLAQGKDAWIYTTGRCGAKGNSLWTVWQPQYGYYWTLFRIYDADGNMIDEQCYGFANVN